MPEQRKYDLEERTTVFGSAIIRFVDRLPTTVAGRHMGGQLIRCGTAPAFHYGESQSAESPKDFIHKIRIAHKELKESRSNIRMLKGAGLLPATDEGMNWLLNEVDELIKIFGKILSTAKKNLDGPKPPQP